MNLLTIKDGRGVTVTYKARIMLGTPSEMGQLFILLGEDGIDDGKSHPQHLEITDGKNINIVFFDCVEVVNSTAYGYSYMTRERSGVIGDFVSFA